MGQSTAAARAAFGREVVSFVAVGRTNPGSRQPERAGFSEMPKKRAKKKTFSAYGYRPGKKFSEYAAEQIAEQAENNETAILSHMRSIAPGKVDPDNDLSLGTPRIEDTSAPGVKI